MILDQHLFFLAIISLLNFFHALAPNELHRPTLIIHKKIDPDIVQVNSVQIYTVVLKLRHVYFQWLMAKQGWDHYRPQSTLQIVVQHNPLQYRTYIHPIEQGKNIIFSFLETGANNLDKTKRLIPALTSETLIHKCVASLFCDKNSFGLSFTGVIIDNILRRMTISCDFNIGFAPTSYELLSV